MNMNILRIVEAGFNSSKLAQVCGVALCCSVLVPGTAAVQAQVPYRAEPALHTCASFIICLQISKLAQVCSVALCCSVLVPGTAAVQAQVPYRAEPALHICASEAAYLCLAPDSSGTSTLPRKARPAYLRQLLIKRQC